MSAVVHYAWCSLMWSLVGYGLGAASVLLFMTPRGRETRLGRWLIRPVRPADNKKVTDMDERLEGDRDDNDFPYRPWRRFLGPILILLAVLSAAGMAYDSGERNRQTKCLAGFVEGVTINIADVRALTAQDRELLDQTIAKLAAGQDPMIYRKLLFRLRAGESAESVLADVFVAASKNQAGADALKQYLLERKRIDAERALHPLPKISNCIDPKDLPKNIVPSPTVPTTLPSGSSG